MFLSISKPLRVSFKHAWTRIVVAQQACPIRLSSLQFSVYSGNLSSQSSFTSNSPSPTSSVSSSNTDVPKIEEPNIPKATSILHRFVQFFGVKDHDVASSAYATRLWNSCLNITDNAKFFYIGC